MIACYRRYKTENSMRYQSMSILIIGNGFDLAHKLPTQYCDFLDFVKAYKDADINRYSSIIPELKENGSNLNGSGV